eukprot:6490378-Amphidinium_carterae.3
MLVLGSANSTLRMSPEHWTSPESESHPKLGEFLKSLLVALYPRSDWYGGTILPTLVFGTSCLWAISWSSSGPTIWVWCAIKRSTPCRWCAVATSGSPGEPGGGGELGSRPLKLGTRGFPFGLDILVKLEPCNAHSQGCRVRHSNRICTLQLDMLRHVFRRKTQNEHQCSPPHRSKIPTLT